MGSAAAGALPEVDLWAPVEFDSLPAQLREAAKREDWNSVRAQLQTVMDGVTTDGAYGRALLQFVMRSPLPPDSVLERYRASICLDHGDWDGLQRCLSAHPVAAAELVGVRDTMLAPVDRTEPAAWNGTHERVLFEAYEFQFQRAVGRWRRWAQNLFSFQTDLYWIRSDMPAGRHVRFRRLHDTLALAHGEAQGGRLPVAQALAREAQSLGDEGEPGRDSARDLELLVGFAMGRQASGDLCLPQRIASPVGLSPLGTWEMLFQAIPFYALRADGSLQWATRLGQRIAVKFGSPRAQLQAHSWWVASELLAGRTPSQAGLPGLLAESQRAAPGLRVLPNLLRAFGSQDPDDFAVAEATARRAGNVWAQVSALTWQVALNPNPTLARWLHRLLETTGWRRPILVPPAIAADAALGLTSVGRRGTSVVELALFGGRANLTIEVALQHIDDPEAPRSARLASVETLGRIATTHSRDILRRLSRRTDQTGLAARRLLVNRNLGATLSDRETEVLDLAGDGLTNRKIADRLTLSPHTVARHIANARAKLGAANRTEAAARFRESSN